MPSINSSPYYQQGPFTGSPQTAPSQTVPLGDIQPTTAEPSYGSQWSLGGSAGTSGIGDGYTGAGSAGASGSGGGWWDSLTQAVSDSGIGQPMGSTLFDNWF
jgi:hypothetical protein